MSDRLAQHVAQLADLRAWVEAQVGPLQALGVQPFLDDLGALMAEEAAAGMRQADINLDLERELDQVCPECRRSIDEATAREAA